VVPITHEQTIICSKTRLDGTTHEQTIICRQLFANLIPRAHVSFGQRQDTELWNNPFQESKILGVPVLLRMRALV